MLLLPLRSPQHPRVRHEHDSDDDAAAATTIYPVSHKGTQFSDSSRASGIQKHPADNMISTLPTTRTPVAKRPKLSLQTSSVPTLPGGHKSRTALNLTVVTQSPTYSNTYANAFNCPSRTTDGAPCTPGDEKTSPLSSPEDRLSSSSSSTSATTLSSCHTSPFPLTAPYCLPLGPRSILRNSPLPRRLGSASTPRTPKLLFPRTKQVCFRERLEELIPTCLVDETPDATDASDSDSSDVRLKDDVAERKALDQLLEEETAKTPAHGRRKRRREWIWRPLEDDILSPRHRNAPTSGAIQASPSRERPMPESKWEEAVPESHRSPCQSIVKRDMSRGGAKDSPVASPEARPSAEDRAAV